MLRGQIEVVRKPIDTVDHQTLARHRRHSYPARQHRTVRRTAGATAWTARPRPRSARSSIGRDGCAALRHSREPNATARETHPTQLARREGDCAVTPLSRRDSGARDPVRCRPRVVVARPRAGGSCVVLVRHQHIRRSPPSADHPASQASDESRRGSERTTIPIRRLSGRHGGGGARGRPARVGCRPRRRRCENGSVELASAGVATRQTRQPPKIGMSTTSLCIASRSRDRFATRPAARRAR